MPDVESIDIIGLLTFAGSFIAAIVKSILWLHQRIKEHIDNQRKDFADLTLNFDTKMNNINNKFDAISSTFNDIIEKIDNIQTIDRYQSNGLQCVLREQLLRDMEPAISLGYVDDHTRENVEHMYRAYRGLDGNGMIESLYKQFSQLAPK